jgi:hypothetical protein
MNKTKVILACILAAIAYGIVHDQITAHLCVEYFTVAHPPLFHTQSPTVLGFCWGVAATIGIGAVLGAILAEVSQSEGLPPYPIPRLCRSLLILLGTMALTALFAGVLGFELSRHSIISLPVTFAELIPQARHDRFMAVWFAHCASYLAGLTGGTFLILRIWNQRGKPRVIALIPRTKPGIIRALILAVLVAVILYIRFARS